MSKYDSSVSSSSVTTTESPVAVKAVGSAAALGAGTLLLLLALGVQFEHGWRVGVGAGALCLVIAGVGALRRVARYALGQLETITRLDLNQDGRIGPDIRLVPVRGGPTVGVDNAVAIADLRYMIERLDYEHQRGWTVREWVGQRLPSGREIIAADVGPYAEFIRVLERIGALAERSERSKGRLLMSSAEILEALGL